MQVLPWTIIFLSIFAILSSCFFSENKLTGLIAFTSSKSHQLFLDINKNKTQKYFQHIIKNKPKANHATQSTIKKESKNTQPTYSNHRLKNYHNMTAKMNIFSLFQDDPITTQYAEKLIDYFYADHPPFQQERSLGKDIVCILQMQGKLLLQKGYTITSLVELFDEEDPKHFMHTLLLRGCPGYHYESATSYPALESLFAINASSPHIIFYFQDIPYPMLSTLFSKAFADELIQKEKLKIESNQSLLSSNEISELFTQHGIPIELMERFDYKTKPKKSMSISASEEACNITYIVPYFL
ncbi:MAG: hypothetical protein HY860_04125 [Chlamydiales bacterium]|nr:hypothetical protein [Chlamydiales bacterium]